MKKATKANQNFLKIDLIIAAFIAIKRLEAVGERPMNMNHIINMIIRQVMNRVIRKGIDTSMNAGSNMMAKRRPKQPPQGEIDDHGNPTGRGPRT